MARPAIAREVRRAFWRHVAAGLSTENAAAAAGVSRTIGYRWFAASGGVMPRRSEREDPAERRPQGRRLTLADREEIAHLLSSGKTDAEIATVLGFSRTTIWRERTRNTTGGRYRATTAQAAADTRHRDAHPSGPLKLAEGTRLRTEVLKRLGENQSPEQIAHRLRRDFPDDPEMHVSHETIYQALYVQGRGALRRELAVCLRTGRAMRKPRAQRTARNARSGNLRDIVSISERPPEVEDRAVPGHWEGDLILGTANASAIGTLVERATGYLILLHLASDHTAETVQEAMCREMAKLPQTLRQTLTWDRGSEMANHAQIAEATGLDIYFCDPGSPWQRGSNENTNGLLRQYFPKGTDLSFWGPGFLDQVARQMNNRPRKRLDWATPAEALDALLSNINNPPGDALTA
ncbi:IS30 family transposase [Nocardioides sp. W7]|uniref:IS30 family transposase n=1 Tax=Nocardioides sp. W7 TaxID=2931390 RepID=UPI001FD62B77|nr:IS30 family transposase [Nocardioides sp. W7]